MQLRVASLNFSGINISPFEYHDGSQEKTTINACFKKLLDVYEAQNPQAYGNIANVDKSFQRDRYTILYRTDVGVLRNKLLSKEQFGTVWDFVYEDKFGSASHDNQTIEMLKMFDKMMYEAFVETVFGPVDWSNIRDYDCKVYLEELRKWHSKCYLQLEVKVRVLCDYITARDLDVLFVQEADVDSISKALPDAYMYSQCSESMIILKKSFYLEDPESPRFSDRFADLLNFNKDTAFIKLKSYLLVSAHLSSKKIKTQQAEIVKEVIQSILTEEPELKVIMGIDANQFLTDLDQLNIYPKTNNNFTTRKRRTNMQLQFEKSEVVVQGVKDHIVTNLKFLESKVETVGFQCIKDEILPNENHPFDHFAVYSVLEDTLLTPAPKSSLVKPPTLSVNLGHSNSLSTNDSLKRSEPSTLCSEGLTDAPSIVIKRCADLRNSDNSATSRLFGSTNNLFTSSKSQHLGSSISNQLYPADNILKFRTSSYIPHHSKVNTQYLKADSQSLKFRHSPTRSRSFHKSPCRETIVKPVTIMLTFNRDRQQNIQGGATSPNPKSHTFRHRRV